MAATATEGKSDSAGPQFPAGMGNQPGVAAAPGGQEGDNQGSGKKKGGGSGGGGGLFSGDTDWSGILGDIGSIGGGLLGGGRESGVGPELEIWQHQKKMAERKLSDAKIFGAAEWLFPGLLAPPLRKGGKSVFGGGKGIGKKQATRLNPRGALTKEGIAADPQAAAAQAAATPLKDNYQNIADAIIRGIMADSTQSQLGIHGGSGAPTGNPEDMGTDATIPATVTNGGGATPLPSTPAAPNVPGSGTAPGPGGGPGGAGTATPMGQPPKKQSRADRKAAKRAARREAAAPGSPTNETYPGDLVMQHLKDMLENPGKLGTETFERAQESANQGLNVSIAAGMGGLTGLGINPKSGLGETVFASAANNFTKARNEAARDYSIAQEQLKRKDIADAMDRYEQFLSTVFGLQTARSNAANPGAMPNARPGGGPSKAGDIGGTLGSVAGDIDWSKILGSGGGGAGGIGTTSALGGTNL